MKFLKRLVFAIIAIIIVLLVIAVFLPSKWHVEESLIIKAPAKIVYEQVVSMKNWDKWTPFRAGDSAMKISYEGAEKGVGAVMKWESKKQGNGKMTIMEAEPFKRIRTMVEFEGQGASISDWVFAEESDATKVTWAIDVAGLKYPLGKLLGIFMPGMLHKSFKTGLTSLKKVGEDYLAIFSKFKTSEVQIKKMEKRYTLYIKDSSRCSEVSTGMSKILGTVMQHIGQNNIECIAPPFVRYLVWDEKADKTVMEGGIFIKGPAEGKDNIKYGELPAQKYVSATHTGAYETIHNTHNAINKYISDNKLTPAGPPMEIYITDPEKEPDMTKWETEILYPVK